MKKILQLLACFLPLIIMLGIQIFTVFGYEFYTLFFMAFTGVPVDIITPSGNISTDTLMQITMIAQVITFFVAIVIYTLGLKNTKLNPFGKTFSLKTIPLLLITFIGAEVVTGCMLEVASIVVPDIMESYAKLIEESGLADLSILSTIATLLLAPISEELVFRGITLRLAQNFTKHFFLANFIQALAFGIAHGNIVQGTYAFCLGLILGYIYKAYNNIIVPMICHLIFNFGGTYMAGVIFGESEEIMVLRLFVTLLISVSVTYAGLYFIKYHEKNYDLNVQAYTERHLAYYKTANRKKTYAFNKKEDSGSEKVIREQLKAEVNEGIVNTRVSQVPPMPGETDF